MTDQPSKVVPMEPTEAMLDAARDWSTKKYGKPIGNDAARGCWAAMLAVAENLSAPTTGTQACKAEVNNETLAFLWNYVEFDGTKTEYLTRCDPRNPSMHDQAWVADVQPLAALKPQTPDVLGEARDYPAEFEAWWATYHHRNRLVADYPIKKQIGFDAFYFAARATPPGDVLGDKSCG